MTREIIEDFRFIVIPYTVNRLKEINYEGQGGSDAKEFMSEFNEICDLAIKALEQELTTKNDLGVDCISRQATINAVKRIHPVDTDYDCTLYDKVDVMYVLDDMPSVTPQEPTIDYRRAFKIACELLSGSVLYGIDSDKIFETAMQKDGLVSNESYERYILNHLQELDHGQYAGVEE